jgi:hypothetical protein
VTEPITQEQAGAVAAINNLLQVVVKGMRATQLYLPNNPVYQRAVQNMRDAFPAIWEVCSDLELKVVETDLVWEGHPVLAQPNKSESLGWLLYKESIRQVTLSPGVEEEELVKFLNVLNKARNLPTDAEDDLLTLLWEQDFQYLKYEAVDLGHEEAPHLEKSDEEPPPPAAVRQAVQEDAEEQPPEGIVNIDDFDSTLYFLDDREIGYLESEIEREYTQDLRGNVLTMLFDLLELQTYSAVRAELISILENFVPYLLAVGDFRSVAYVLQQNRDVVQRARELLPEHRTALERFPDRLSDPEAMGQLLQSLDEAVVHPTEEELGELFRELRPAALATLLGWLPRLGNERVRNLLDAAARRLAQAHPDELVAVLGRDELDMVIEGIRLAGQLKLPPVVPALGAVLENGSDEVRRAATAALAAIGSPGAFKQLERGLDDPDRDVRIGTVRAIGRAGQRGALDRIEAAINGKQLLHADLSERTAFFEAYGLLAGRAGIDTLKGMLLVKGGLLKRKVDPQIRACAAMALGKINTPEAREILLEVGQDKDPVVRTAVNRALKEGKG